MKFLIFIFFFSFNKSLQTLTFEWNPVVTSIDKRGTSKITSWANKLINTSNKSILPKVSVIISLTDTNLLHGDVSYPITFNLNYNNGEFGVDGYKLLLGLRGPHTKILNDSDIALNIYDSDSIIHSNPIINEFQSIESAQNAIVLCSYNYSHITFQEEQIQENVNNINKIIKIKNITVFLKEGILFRVQYSNNIMRMDKLNITENNNIKTAFGIEMFGSSNSYLVVIGNDKTLRIFSVNFITNDLLIYKRINSFDYTNIHRFGVLSGDERIFFFSYNEGGLMEIVFDNNIEISPTSNVSSISQIKSVSDSTLEQKQITDFIVLNHTIYAISKDKGLILFDINLETKNIIYNKIIYHPQMSKLDLVTNPFNGNMYLGVSVIQENPNEEFFIEFFLYEENIPIVNKVFTSYDTTISSIPYIQYDAFSSLFLSNNKLYIIRRGMVSSVKFVSYVIPLKSPLSDSTSFFTLINPQDKYNQIIIGYSNYTYVIPKIFFPPHVIKCSFQKEGKYSMRFLQNIDSCLSNMGKKVRMFPCRKIIDANYEIYAFKESKVVVIGLSFIGVVFLITLLILTCVTCKYTRCFKENRIKVIAINKNEKDEIYEDSDESIGTEEEEDNENEEKNSVQVINFYNEKPELYQRKNNLSYATLDQENLNSINSRNRMYEIDRARKQSSSSDSFEFNLNRNDLSSEIDKKTTDMALRTTDFTKTQLFQIQKKNQ